MCHNLAVCRDWLCVVCHHSSLNGPRDVESPPHGRSSLACVRAPDRPAAAVYELYAKLDNQCASGTEGDACGLVWANKVLQRAAAYAAGLAALQPGSCRLNEQGYAAIQDERGISWSAGVDCGVVSMEMQERCRLAVW